MADLVIPVLGIGAAEATLGYITRCHLKKTKTKKYKEFPHTFDLLFCLRPGLM